MPKEEGVKKKKWSRPKLIVLIRSKPGEALLVACKAGDWVAGPGPADVLDYCITVDLGICVDCAIVANS